jgi:RNAse (barnase) inhibitor barstar
MKFTTIATSALACSSIWAAPVNQASQSNNNTLTTQDTYNTTYPYDIRQYVNAEQIYDQIQEIAKIPKDEFIQKTNEGIDKIQKVLDISLDLGQRLDNLSDDQKQQLNALWTQVAPKYEQPLPSDPNQLKQLVAPDLLQFIQIVYQGDSIQALNNYTQLLQN